MIPTSADVDQCCSGFHEGQLPVADQACGFWGQVDCEHDEIRLFKQVLHVLTVSSAHRPLILNTPAQHREDAVCRHPIEPFLLSYSYVFTTRLPPPPVVIQDLHVKSFASLCDFVPDISHSNDSQSRACDFNSEQILR